jgi:hypothetical protein
VELLFPWLDPVVAMILLALKLWSLFICFFFVFFFFFFFCFFFFFFFFPLVFPPVLADLKARDVFEE